MEKEEAEQDLKRPVYERDWERFNTLSNLTYELRNYITGIYSYREKKHVDRHETYPPSISQLKTTIPIDILNSISYKSTKNGKGYEIGIKFETDEAIEALKGVNYARRSTFDEDRNVVFDESEVDIYVPYNFSKEPPKSFLAEFYESRDELLSYLPSEISIDSRVGGSSMAYDPTNIEKYNAQFEMEVNASFGDSSYAFGFDILLKDSVVYFRLNKIPSLPGIMAFFDLTAIKGEWVKITKDDFDIDRYLYLNDVGFEIDDEVDKDQADLILKKNQELAVKMLKKAVEIIKSEGIIFVSDGPIKEEAEDRILYRYDIAISKDSIVPAYKRIVGELVPIINEVIETQYPLPSERAVKTLDITKQDEILKVLESEDFNRLFEHLRKNNKFSIYFQKNRIPVGISNSLRIIPISENKPMSEVQYIFKTSAILDDINETINIDAPKDFITFKDAYESVTGETWKDPFINANNAVIKTNLNNIRAHAELYYDNSNNSYGLSNSPGDCFNDGMKKSIFTNIDIENLLTEDKNSLGSNYKSICASSTQSYAVAFSLAPDGNEVISEYYCIDSSGSASTISKKNSENLIVGSGTLIDPYGCAK